MLWIHVSDVDDVRVKVDEDNRSDELALVMSMDEVLVMGDKRDVKEEALEMVESSTDEALDVDENEDSVDHV